MPHSHAFANKFKVYGVAINPTLIEKSATVTG